MGCTKGRRLFRAFQQRLFLSDADDNWMRDLVGNARAVLRGESIRLA